jgi:hypothetical protein
MRLAALLPIVGLLDVASALAAPGDALALPDAIRTELNLPPIYDYRATDLKTLRRGFANPPREVGPWVYWFWWNNVVSREEIARELEEMAAAGLAGAELRVVTFHGWGGPPLEGMDDANLERLGQRRLRYLSDEWLDVMEFTCAKAQQLGLRLAVNLGQGWPPGGPWITDQHRSKHLSWRSHEVEGPTAVVLSDFPADTTAFAWRLTGGGASKVVATNSFQNLAPFFQREGTRASLRWEAPSGRWLVGVFSVTPGGICDKGEGPEADPGSKEAVLFHLNYFFGRLDPKLRRFYGTTLVDVASDSWEYERGGNRYWSPAILEVFPSRAGYDLRERFYALLGYGPDGERVRHDLETIEQRLVHENFFATVAGFLHERGLRHRPQAYGRGLARDLLYAYALADTPEIEPTLVLPEAVWADRTTGRPVVSAEAFTFLGLYQSQGRSPVRMSNGPWEATPAALRLAANHFYGEGINRIQMHGFGYSPPGLPLPGWRMYAEVHFNRNVPWWPFMKPLTTWMARQQWLLQAGWPVADTLVYPVTPNPPDGPFFQMADRQPISAGNAIDAASELTLSRVPAACTAGLFEVRNLCLLSQPQSRDEAQAIGALLDTGARLWCCQSLPADWPALAPANAESLRQRFARAQGEGRVVDARATGWKTALAQTRSVEWSPNTASLVYQHRRVRDAEIYFVVNYGEPFTGHISFPHPGRRVERWNPDTGEAVPVAQHVQSESRLQVPLALAHFESACFVFSKEAVPVHITDAADGMLRYDTAGRLVSEFSQLDLAGERTLKLSDGSTHRVVVPSLPPPRPVSGPWKLSVTANQAVSPQAPLTLTLNRLVSWRELPELRRYAGRATYSTEVEVPPEWLRPEITVALELGEVFELARVAVNGHEVGIAWTPPFRLDITAALTPGRNLLEIEVPNLLKNHLESGDGYWRPSGLLGPVHLVPQYTATIVPSGSDSP